MNLTQNKRKIAGLCITCTGVPSPGRVRCEPCAEKNRAPHRKGGSCWSARIFRELAADTGTWRDAGNLTFIRAQVPEAIPFLAKLFSISEDKINSIRKVTISRDRGQRMPLKLLKELAEQREERLNIDDFNYRESSIVECSR